MSTPAPDGLGPRTKTVVVTRKVKGGSHLHGTTPEVIVQSDGKEKFVIVNGMRIKVGDDIPEGATYKVKTKRKTIKKTKIKKVPKYRDVHYLVRIGRRRAYRAVEPPLSNFWHRANEIRDFLIFFANLAFSAWDLFSDLETDLPFKVTSFIIGLGEIILMGIIWILSICCTKKMSSKKAQYTENLLLEILLFIAIVLALYGLVVGKDYMIDERPKIIGMALLIIDIADLIILYCLRLLFVKKFANAITLVLQREDPTFSLSETTGKLPGVVMRSFICIIGNSVVFAFLLFVLGLQIHEDNNITEDYTFTFRQFWLVLCALIIPTSSLAVFLLANFHWLMQYMVQLSLISSAVIEKVREDENEELADITEEIHVAEQQREEAMGKLKKLQKASHTQKFLYPVNEWWIMLITAIWFLCLFTVPIAIETDGTHVHTEVLVGSLVGYFVCVLISNWQAVVVIFAFLPCKLKCIGNGGDETKVGPENLHMEKDENEQKEAKENANEENSHQIEATEV